MDESDTNFTGWRIYMTQAKSGDTVKVHYTGTLSDNTEFDSSQGGEPLSFTIGQNMVIPGFENGVVGMKVGESKKVMIPADQAYGPYNNELVAAVPRSQVPPELDVSVGMVLQVRSTEGGLARAIVRDVSENEITLDLNHPLAGQDLTFEIELVEITGE
jgi:peptidylprolyl isomerase